MKYYILLLLVFLSVNISVAQQAPHYTQYMYNTQVVNPAYIGSKDAISIGLLYRNQWAGFDGSPKTGTFTASTPLGELKRMGLGLSIVNDKIGPSSETNFLIDYSYSLILSSKSRLSFGLKAGFDIFNIDYTLLDIYDETDMQFSNNIDNKFQPQIGLGIFYHTDNMYIGLSAPSLLRSNYYDSSIASTTNDGVELDQVKYYLTGGYVFNINDNLKFKPATLVKYVDRVPLQVDISANFLINNRLTLGTAYRWDESITTMAGFQINNQLFIGMAYDFETNEIRKQSNGSYEVFFRYDIGTLVERILTPRFF